MRITYTEFVPNPNLRGTTVNLPAHVAQVLIAQGSAVAVPYKSYQDRLASEFSSPAVPVKIEWGIQQGSASQYSRPAITKRVGSEATFYSTPPADCPAAIAEQFRQLVDGTLYELPPDEAAMHAAAAYVGDSNKHRPVLIGHNKKTGEPLYRNPEDFVKR